MPLAAAWSASLRLPPAALILFACLIWSATHALRKDLLQDFSVYWMTLTMVLTILPCILLMLRVDLRAAWQALRRHPRGLLLYGLLSTGVGTTLFLLSLSLMPLALVASLSGLEALFVCVLAALFLRERLAPAFWLYAALAIVSCTVLVVHDPMRIDLSAATLPGVLAIVGAALAWAAATVLAKFALAREVAPNILLFWRYTGGLALLLAGLPFFWAQGAQDLSRLDAPSLMIHVGCALAGGIPAYLWFYYGMRHLEVSRSTLLELARPASGVLFGLMFFEERLTAWQSAALPLFLFALWRISLLRAQARDAPAGG